MKFVFDKDTLMREIAVAQEIISTKNIGSVLSNVLLIAKDNMLLIKATDLKVTFETSIPVEVQEEGNSTVYCDKLMQILSNLPQGENEFAQKTDSLDVVIRAKTLKKKYDMKSMTEDKFPDFDSTSDSSYFELPAKDLKEMIYHTQFAVSDDETRYFMNGIFFEKTDDILALVSTDGKRLAIDKRQIGSAIQDFSSAIVHPKVLNILQKRASDEGMISLAVVEKKIFFKFANYLLSSTLIEGQFPNYRHVIPEKQEVKFTLQKSDIEDAIKSVSLMLDKRIGKIYFNLKDGSLQITSPETEYGVADVEIPCEYSGAETTIAFNCRFIEEPLRVMNSERVTFEFTDTLKAVTMRPEPEGEYFNIVMPSQL